MIQLIDLHKEFEDKKVLKGINTTFEAGQTNLIIGQSGSGKTVLMKCIVGLFSPTSGQILYDGRDIVAMSKKERVMLRREMGMIFQSAALFDSLTVEENVMFPLDMFSNESYKERVRRARFCLDRVNLSDAGHKYPGEISGGMQKRVAIARAIVNRPLLLIADEPTGNLDPDTSKGIMDIFTKINHMGTTVLMVTHDKQMVDLMNKRVIEIDNGRIVRDELKGGYGNEN